MASAASSTFRFLDLPAEIRNLIYSLLFERHGPCYAAIEDEGDPRPPHTTLLRRGDWIVIPMNDSNKTHGISALIFEAGEGYYVAIDHFTAKYAILETATSNPPGDIDLSDTNDDNLTPMIKAFTGGWFNAAVLRVCKQISNEAKKLSYNNNSFTVLGSIFDRRWTSSSTHIGSIVPGTAWLSGNGRNERFLQHLEMDFSFLPYWAYATKISHMIDHVNLVNCWPSMQYLWKQADPVEVNFVKAYLNHGELVKSEEGFTRLNRTFQSLREDQPGYKKFSRTIVGIAVNRDGSNGCFLFLATYSMPAHHKYRPYFERPLCFISNGEDLSLLPRLRRETLESLPSHPRKWILKHVWTYKDIQKISLKSKADIIRATPPALVPSNSHGYLYPTSNSFNVELQSDIKEAFFSFWYDLRRLKWRASHVACAGSGSREISQDNPSDPWSLSEFRTLSFTIAFDLGVEVKPEEVSFDGVPLLHYTAWMYEWCEVHIEVRNASTESIINTHTLSLGELRDLILDTWSQIHVRVDEFEYPEICINGRGEVVRTTRILAVDKGAGRISPLLIPPPGYGRCLGLYKYLQSKRKGW